MKNIKVILEYDGTGFAGWQFQPDQRTLQGEFEAAVKKISGEEFRVTASGRTDAGVHALGQVVNFKTSAGMDARAWLGALNHFLPPEMRALEVSEVPEDFNARYSAKGKQYGYIILNRQSPSPLKRNYSWHVPMPLDIAAMKEGAAHLLGEHDFTSFRAVNSDSINPVKTMRSLEILPDGNRIFFSLEADGFLRHMVRTVVGTLVEVGKGRFAPDDVKDMLEARARTKAGPTAPGQGLYLVRVEY
ncbi:MAG: tRNA pseudouridine(38-40) synthase TruA [Nitrospirota bacterium]